MVVSILFYLLNSCDKTNDHKLLFLEVNRHMDVPPKKNEIIKLAIICNETDILVEKYYMYNIIKTSYSNSLSLHEIINSQQKSFSEINSFLLENGSIVKELTLNIDSLNSFISSNLVQKEKKETPYIRLYSEFLNDAKLGYLEYFFNNIEKTENINLNENEWQHILYLGASDLDKDNTHFKVSLLKNKTNLFKMSYDNKETIPFYFEID
jgi:hypothetical protein